MKKINVIFGASGFAKEVEFIITRLISSGDIDEQIRYFVAADDDDKIGQFIRGIPVISESEFYEKFSRIKVSCYIAIGSPKIKEKIVSRLKKEATVNFPFLIDPSVTYDKRPAAVLCQEGSIICGHSILTTDINVGAFSHINIDCTIGHDSVIGEYATLSPGVHISGKVKIGKGVFIGTGAVILEDILIENDASIGAGAVVTKNVREKSTVIGVPAKERS
ncbi:MAG: NeuD/PglB/VioB family sugar acetyltransferase [Gallionellaceae bacterium]